MVKNPESIAVEPRSKDNRFIWTPYITDSFVSFVSLFSLKLTQLLTDTGKYGQRTLLYVPSHIQSYILSSILCCFYAVLVGSLWVSLGSLWVSLGSLVSICVRV